MYLKCTFTMLFLLITLVGCGDNAASAPAPAAGAAAAPVEAPVEAVKSADDPAAP